jgi:hypothetical protein
MSKGDRYGLRRRVKGRRRPSSLPGKIVLATATANLPSFNLDRQFFNDHPERNYCLRKPTSDEETNMDGKNSEVTYTVVKRARHGRLKACIDILRGDPDNTEDNAQAVWELAREKFPHLRELHDRLEEVLNREQC